MTETSKPLTIVEIKKWLQKTISRNARIIDKNYQTIQYNTGKSKWPPPKKGNCSWLSVSTDAKRHVMVWTLSGSDYMKQEARKLATMLETVIHDELGQIVPIEFKDAPQYIVTSTGKSIGICRGEVVKDDAEIADPESEWHFHHHMD
jgi:hypothetical protein